MCWAAVSTMARGLGSSSEPAVDPDGELTGPAPPQPSTDGAGEGGEVRGGTQASSACASHPANFCRPGKTVVGANQILPSFF